MSTTQHEKTVETILQNSAYQGTIFAAPYHEQSEDRAVCMYPGPDQEDPKYKFHSSEVEFKHTLIVRNRAEPEDWKTAREDSLVIADALKNEHPSDYAVVRLLRGPYSKGQDGQDRYEFICEVLCWIEE